MGKKFVTTLIGFFLVGTNAVLAQTPSTGSGQVIDPFVTFTVEGRSRMAITYDRDRTGSHGFDLWNESDNAEQDLLYDRQNITYTDPGMGDYDIQFAGRYDEDILFRLTYYDGEQYRETDMRRWNVADRPTEMTVTINNGEDGWMMDSDEFAHPIGQGIKNSDHTDIQWSTVNGAVSYRIYSKIWDYPYYSLLTETTSTSTQTDIPWATDSGDPLHPTGLYYFVVTAVLDSGNETILSPIITNADQDNDGYNDFRELDLGTDPTDSDTDDDGIPDFLEQNRYYTNPLDPDSDGDGHNDGDEVDAGTLPNQADSYPGRINECGAPDDGDWHVSKDCTVIEDQNIPADLIVHPDSVLTVGERITMWFDYTRHKILVMFGGGIHLKQEAQIRQK